MGLKKQLGKVVGSFNPTRYMGGDALRQNGRFLNDLCSAIAKPATGNVQDTSRSFEEIMQSAGITQSDLDDRIQLCRRFFRMELIFIMALVSYSLFLFLSHQPFSGFITILLSLLMCCYAWREHFFLTKLRYKRATLTVKDWLYLLLKRS